MKYDYDLIVIGGGPAGCASAIRARWIRTYDSIPSSVAILDNNGIGGIANWKEIRITGEGWRLDGSDLMKKLEKDIKKLNIPVFREKVKSIKNFEDYHLIETDRGEYTTLSVVIATGLTSITNHRKYFGKGLIPTLKDHKFMCGYLDELLEKNKGRHFIIIGTEPAKKFYKLFKSINKGRVTSEIIIENKNTRVKQIIGNGHKIKGVKLEKIENNSIKNDEVASDIVIIDFESYMVNNNSSYFVPDILKKNGFIKTNKLLSTKTSGLFAAGDITGPPFCVATAIGEGVTAGFEAYRFTFKKKFGIEPPLYAFYPSKAEEYSDKTGFSIKIITENHKPKFLNENIKTEIQNMPLDGTHTIKEIIEKTGFNKEHINEILMPLIKEKKITFHI